MPTELSKAFDRPFSTVSQAVPTVVAGLYALATAAFRALSVFAAGLQHYQTTSHAQLTPCCWQMTGATNTLSSEWLGGGWQAKQSLPHTAHGVALDQVPAGMAASCVSTAATSVLMPVMSVGAVLMLAKPVAMVVPSAAKPLDRPVDRAARAFTRVVLTRVLRPLMEVDRLAG